VLEGAGHLIFLLPNNAEVERLQMADALRLNWMARLRICRGSRKKSQ
jgi:hypothetical protein